MIEIDGKKVQCPNCTELLYQVTMDHDGTTSRVFWFHQYENFCMDVIEDEYYKDNSTHPYFNMLKQLFRIDLNIKEISNENSDYKQSDTLEAD